jgi:hypothetical protein
MPEYYVFWDEKFAGLGETQGESNHIGAAANTIETGIKIHRGIKITNAETAASAIKSIKETFPGGISTNVKAAEVSAFTEE